MKPILFFQCLIMMSLGLLILPLDIHGHAIHDAAEKGDIAKVTKLLKRNPNLVKAWKSKYDPTTPLHLAAYNGHYDIAALLLKHGADVNCTGMTGPSRTYDKATKKYTARKTLHLHIRSVGVSKDNQLVTTPLIAACLGGGSGKVVDLLIAKGASVNEVVLTHKRPSLLSDEKGRIFPLHIAAARGQLRVVNSLLTGGIDIQAEGPMIDGSGFRSGSLGKYTALHCASKTGQAKVVNVLLKAGAKDIRPKLYGKGKYILNGAYFLAIEYGNRETIQVYLKHGANPNLLFKKANLERAVRPLHIACRRGDRATAEFLLKNGAKINALDSKGNVPLHYACLSSSGGGIGICCTFSGRQRRNPKRVDKDFVKYLIAKGANVRAISDQGVTPLHIAVALKNNDIAKVLLANGADINAKLTKCCPGNTPFHIAVKTTMDVEFLKFLIANGAKAYEEVSLKSGRGSNQAENALTYIDWRIQSTRSSQKEKRAKLKEMRQFLRIELGYDE